MSKDKMTGSKLALTMVGVVIAMVNIIPGTIFLAYSCSVIWNMMARDLYPQITTGHVLGPMIVASLAMYKTVDCKKPDRTTGEAIALVFFQIAKPYLLGGWFMLCAWIISLFI